MIKWVIMIGGNYDKVSNNNKDNDDKISNSRLRKSSRITRTRVRLKEVAMTVEEV